MNKKGFTLMELLVVVIIIAGLSAVVYPGYKSAIERARASEAVNMIAAIQAAQQKHFVNYETYGTTFQDINDFKPAMPENANAFDPSQNHFSTEYFKYTLDGENKQVSAQRVDSNGTVINKGYELVGAYNDNFIKCNVLNGSEDGEKVCSSLTDRAKNTDDDYYEIH